VSSDGLVPTPAEFVRVRDTIHKLLTEAKLAYELAAQQALEKYAREIGLWAKEWVLKLAKDLRGCVSTEDVLKTWAYGRGDIPKHLFRLKTFRLDHLEMVASNVRNRLLDPNGEHQVANNGVNEVWLSKKLDVSVYKTIIENAKNGNSDKASSNFADLTIFDYIKKGDHLVLLMRAASQRIFKCHTTVSDLKKIVDGSLPTRKCNAK
jgi:hypothetical protein